MSFIDNEIYLDKEFIIESYQKVTGDKPIIKYERANNQKLGINLGISGEATIHESYEYPVSIYSMYSKIQNELNEKIDIIELTEDNIQSLPDIFWIEALFGIIRVTSNVNTPKEQINYVFTMEKEKLFIKLVLNNSYFSSGYGELQNNIRGLDEKFAIKAKVLIKKVRYISKLSYMCTFSNY
jgi:hypothetical protein